MPYDDARNTQSDAGAPATGTDPGDVSPGRDAGRKNLVPGMPASAAGMAPNRAPMARGAALRMPGSRPSSLDAALEAQRRRIRQTAEEPEAPRTHQDAPITEPTGEGEWLVASGDCMTRIAHESGHLLDTLVAEPTNARLNEARKSPNVLLPGDRVYVPPIRPKTEPAETERRHRFVKHGEPAMLRLVMKNNDEPRGGVDYRLVIDGRPLEGTTDAEGKIDVPIPPNARKGTLTLADREDEEYELELGHLDPVESVMGVCQRLSNLGLPCKVETEEDLPALRHALAEFQRMRGLPATGDMDEQTRRALESTHGS